MKWFLALCLTLITLVGISRPHVQAQTSQTSPDTQPLFASPVLNPGVPPITLPNFSTLFNDKVNESNQSVIAKAVNQIVTILLLVGGITAFGFVLYGGFRYVMAGPNPAATDQAKKIIVGSIVGILIMALASVIVQYIINAVVTATK